MIKVDVKNIKNVEKALAKYGDEAIKEFGEITKIKALAIVDDAQALVPRNKSTLALSIKQTKVDKLTYNAGTEEPYAPYMEFGTGPRVQVPSEFKDLANRAKKQPKGSFDEGLKAIKQWCKDVGIDEKAAYPIFVAILNNGLTPRPFMYPAFVKARATYSDDIEDAIKRLNKKFNNG